MCSKDAADLIALLEENGFEVYVDGGWGVDAVLGEQTRPHDDLDIAMLHAQVPRLRALLSMRGFREQRRDDSWECNFVLADEAGRRLDVHSYTLDAAGLNAGGVPYTGEQLTGGGSLWGGASAFTAGHSIRFTAAICGWRPPWSKRSGSSACC